MFRLRRAMRDHEESYPLESAESPASVETPNFMPVSTFPPCAIMFDHQHSPQVCAGFRINH